MSNLAHGIPPPFEVVGQQQNNQPCDTVDATQALTPIHVYLSIENFIYRCNIYETEHYSWYMQMQLLR